MNMIKIEKNIMTIIGRSLAPIELEHQIYFP